MNVKYFENNNKEGSCQEQELDLRMSNLHVFDIYNSIAFTSIKEQMYYYAIQ